MTSDEDLARLIQSDLLNDSRVAAESVDVDVESGVVTLRGKVPSYRRKLLAHEIAACQEGVRDVVDNLTVEPTAALSDEEVAAKVRAALDASAEVTKKTISVSVTAGKVTLTGNVGSDWEWAMAADVTRSTQGVREVHNLLRVDLERKVDDSELCSSVEAAIRRSRGLADASLSVTVSNGQVILAGQVDALWKKETAEAVARRFGMRSIRNEILVVHPDPAE